jgi:hypothetical protein
MLQVALLIFVLLQLANIDSSEIIWCSLLPKQATRQSTHIKTKQKKQNVLALIWYPISRFATNSQQPSSPFSAPAYHAQLEINIRHCLPLLLDHGSELFQHVVEAGERRAFIFKFLLGFDTCSLGTMNKRTNKWVGE